MNLVVGLGNPGRKYENTRHNTGFRVIDELSRRWAIPVNRRKFQALAGVGLIGPRQVVLLKPTTYMNRSGQCVREALKFYKLELADLVVVLDDMALPLGRLRIRPAGSGGGHNGLIDIIEELDAEEFTRIRVGIDFADSADSVDHVLSSFAPHEEAIVTSAIGKAADAVECWLNSGLETAMNKFNRPDPPADMPRDPDEK